MYLFLLINLLTFADDDDTLTRKYIWFAVNTEIKQNNNKIKMAYNRNIYFVEINCWKIVKNDLEN